MRAHSPRAARRSALAPWTTRRIAIALLAAGVLALACLSPHRLAPTRRAGTHRPDGYERARCAGHVVLSCYADPTGHASLPAAAPGSWRLGPGRSEAPQTFDDYCAADPVGADDQRRAIVIQPLGALDAHWSATFEALRAFTAAYFDVPVEVAPALPLPIERMRIRHHGSHSLHQYHAGTLMDSVLLPRLPAHAICLLGVTVEDLYPEDGWNYVFGQAYLHRRVGVYSLARYQPSFWGQEDSPESRRLARLRALKVLAHETGHMFGMEHCLHFACCLNGSNSLSESDAQPLWLCPVCASKLTWNRGLDPLMRYRRLAQVLRELDHPDEAAWYQARAAALESR